MGQRKKFDKAFKEQIVLRILAGETKFAGAAWLYLAGVLDLRRTDLSAA